MSKEAPIRVRLLAGLSVLSLIAVACSAAEAGTEVARPTIEATEQVLSGLQPTLPLSSVAARVMIGEEDHWLVENTIRSCMEAQGFQYAMQPYSPDDLIAVDRRYGVINERDATALDHEASHQGDAATSGSSEGMNSGFESLDAVGRENWDSAFFGDARVRIEIGTGVIERSSGGCLEYGRAAAVGDVSAWTEAFYRVQFLLGDAYAQAEADPRVIDSVASWSACMKSAGYNAATPEALSYIQGDDLMATSADCNNSVGLAATWMQVEGEIQHELWAVHGARLEELLNLTTLAG